MYEPYIFKKINDRFYIIAEMHNVFPANEKSNPLHTCTFGLVIGERKAALIDSGTGIGNLAAFISQFTALPIVVLNTHTHLDHIGADSLFEKIFFSEKDVGLLPLCTKESRLGFLKTVLEGSPDKIKYAEKHIIGDAPFEYGFIEDGDCFDLGGIQLEAIAFPGHTKGSLAFLDRRDGVVFTGDSILFRVLLNLEESTPVPDYIKSMDRFLEKIKGIDVLIPGHQWEPFHKSDALELRECAAEIVNGVPGSPITLLGKSGHIHEHRKKRIVF